MRYGQPDHESFSQKIESIQDHGAIAVANGIKLHSNLSLESLKFRRCFRRLTTFYKPITSELIQYLVKFIRHDSQSYQTRSTRDITTNYFKTDIFKYSFFSFIIFEWNKLDLKNCY